MSSETLYCTSGDVERILGIQTEVGDKPMVSQIKDFILDAMAYIERETGHAWREVRGEMEYHEIGLIGRRLSWFSFTGYPIYLWHRAIKPIDKSKGDVFDVLEGETWNDWSDKFASGELWLDTAHGVVYFRSIYGMKGYWLRTKYRYGETSVPHEIRLATALVAASFIASSADKWNIIAEGATGVLAVPAKIEFWMAEAKRIIDVNREVRVP